MTKRERLEGKLERRQEWAEGRDKKAEAAFGRAHKAVEGIPPGQPILVGHHSEQHHRGALKRHDGAMRAGFESEGMAAHHRSKAAGLETQLENSIFSDDPGAVEALEAKASAIEAGCERKAVINKAFRKGKGAEGWTALVQPPMTEAEQKVFLDAAQMHAKAYGDRLPFKGFPSYSLSNARGNARRLRQRIEEIKQRQTQTAKAEAAPGGVLIHRVPDHDLCQVTFAEKPDRAILNALKAAGFHWGGGSWAGSTSRLPAEVQEIAEEKRASDASREG